MHAGFVRGLFATRERLPLTHRHTQYTRATGPIYGAVVQGSSTADEDGAVALGPGVTRGLGGRYKRGPGMVEIGDTFTPALNPPLQDVPPVANCQVAIYEYAPPDFPADVVFPHGLLKGAVLPAGELLANDRIVIDQRGRGRGRGRGRFQGGQGSFNGPGGSSFRGGNPSNQRRRTGPPQPMGRGFNPNYRGPQRQGFNPLYRGPPPQQFPRGYNPMGGNHGPPPQQQQFRGPPQQFPRGYNPMGGNYGPPPPQLYQGPPPQQFRGPPAQQAFRGPQFQPRGPYQAPPARGPPQQQGYGGPYAQQGGPGMGGGPPPQQQQPYQPVQQGGPGWQQYPQQPRR